MTLPLHITQHLAAEILACAADQIFPGTELISGKSINGGFYYDFIIRQRIDEQFISVFEETIRGLIKGETPIRILSMMKENAVQLFLHRKQPLKAELVASARENIVQILQLGDFYDYAPSKSLGILDLEEIPTSEIGCIKILEIKSAIRPLPSMGELQVTRVQGTCHPDLPTLKKFLKKRESAKKIDHRLIGKEMNLFINSSEISTSSYFLSSKGMKLKEILLNLWRKEHQNQGFQFLLSPQVVKGSFLKKAGILTPSKQPESLFPELTLEGTNYYLSPTPAPCHAEIFKSQIYSEKDLPIRYAESYESYENDAEEQLFGLLQTKHFTADSAHIFCTQEQLLQELISSLQFINKIVNMLRFEHRWHLPTCGQKTAVTLKKWNQARDLMLEALEFCGFGDKILSDAEQEETQAQANLLLNGPRIELKLIDALDREWNGPHIAVNFNLPTKFALSYKEKNNAMQQQPVMISRSLFGSLERMMALLIEQHRGVLPLWLAPEQMRVIPIGDKDHSYAEEVLAKLKQKGLRVGFDARQEPLKVKIHTVERECVPYALIIGEREQKDQLIAVRPCGQERTTSRMHLEALLQKLHEEIRSPDVDETINRSE